MGKILKIVVLLLIITGIGVAYWISKNTAFIKIPKPTPRNGQNNTQQRNNESQPTLSDTYLPLKKFEIQTPLSQNHQTGTFSNEQFLNLPEGFEIEVFASGFTKPRLFDFDDDGVMYLTDQAGSVYAVSANGEKTRIESGLNKPHGIDYYNGSLYVAEEDKVVVYRQIKTNGTYSSKQVLISKLPTGGNHVTRTLRIGSDEKIYLTIGSTCNVCEEKDPRRAALLRYNLDGSGEELFANGLRNTVGFIFKDGNIWGVDNGRDLIGDKIPPEEVNVIENGKHYGWPYCYGDRIPNPEYASKKSFCLENTEAPYLQMPAHTAPLSLTYLSKEQRTSFPQELANNLFVAQHGSWNSSVPVGYKIVRFDLSSEKKSEIDFITGWLDENGQVFGRPVHVDFGPDGNMYISDDKAGVVYKVLYKTS